MSSRTRVPRNRASKLPVADKPQFTQKKKKPQGSQVRKSKSSPAEPSHGTKVEVKKIATSPPHQGAKAEEPNIRACPHQGSENIFSFIFCKPDCPRSAAGEWVNSSAGQAFGPHVITIEAGEGLEALEGSRMIRVFAYATEFNSRQDRGRPFELNLGQGSDVEFDPAVPYVPFPGYDPTKRYL